MFQFFKRTGQKHHTGASVLQKSLEPRNFDYKIENSSFVTLEDDDCDLDTETPQSSRLSKTLNDVLCDKNALKYFIQFLNTQDALKYVKCYLDIEYFRTLSKTSEQFSGTCLEHDRLSLNADCVSLNADCKSSNTDCNSFNADSNSFNADSNSFSADGSLLDTDVNSFNADFSSFNAGGDSFNAVANRLELRDISFKMSKVGLKSTKNSDSSDRQLGNALTEIALRIFKKYVALEGLYFVACPDEMRNELVESICSESVLDVRCFDRIQRYVYGVLDEMFFNAFQRSQFNCKYHIDVLTSGCLTLEDILYNESILFYFIEFLEQEGLGSLLEFWLAAANFRAGFHGDLNATHAQNDAIILYEKYFSLQATNPLGFGDKTRFQIESNICHENGIFQNCFSTPVKLIENYLNKNHLKQFITSELYFKYLSELISTVQTFGLRHPTHNRSNSDGSSEISSTHFIRDSEYAKHNAPKTDMSIDTRQLYDPDSLWRRRKTSRLSFGRMTELGRFETDVEPNPGRRGEWKLARAVKRLMHSDERNTKEEMAWQIAEMIVKDVTNVTLKTGHSKT